VVSPGGRFSNCTEGHIQGSPLCATCEPGYYDSNAECVPCGPKRRIQVTIALGLAMAVIAFLLLLYFFVRPGADIDDVVENVKDKMNDGPSGQAFNQSLSMRYFLSNTVSPAAQGLPRLAISVTNANLDLQVSKHLATKLTRLTAVPELWSKAKISITFLQIMASLNVAYNIPWPPKFIALLNKLSFLNLNILSFPGLAYTCIAEDVDFFSKFLLAFCFPLVLTLVFLLAYYSGIRIIKNKVRSNLQVVRSLEEQAAYLKKQMLKKMSSISFRIKRLRRQQQLRQESLGDRSETAAPPASDTSSPPPPASPPRDSFSSPTPASGTPSPDKAIVASSPSQRQDPLGNQLPLSSSLSEISLSPLPTPVEDKQGSADLPGLGSLDDVPEMPSPAVRSTVIEIRSPSQPADKPVLAESSSAPAPATLVKRATFADPPSIGTGPSNNSLVSVASSDKQSTGGSGSSGQGMPTPAGDTKGDGEESEDDEEEAEDSMLALRKKVRIGPVYIDAAALSNDRQSVQVALLEKQQDVENFSIERYTSRLITLWFWIILLIYPAVSRVVLEAVNCRTLDRGQRFLVADYSINCNSSYYTSFLPLIGPALVLYPIGIPLLFFLMLKFKRNVHPWDENLSFLYKTYRPEFWWFEVYELLRKLVLTGLIIFVMSGTATQIAIACIICACSICIHLRLRPYEEYFDDILQGFSLAELLVMTYCALLLKLDLTGADKTSLIVFDYILVISNGVVVLGIMPASFYIQVRAPRLRA
jgi:hypothetical protein